MVNGSVNQELQLLIGLAWIEFDFMAGQGKSQFVSPDRVRVRLAFGVRLANLAS